MIDTDKYEGHTKTIDATHLRRGHWKRLRKLTPNMNTTY